MDPIHTVVSRGGRVVIPAALRNAFGIEEGDELTIVSDDSGIHILTLKMVMKRLQKRADELVPTNKKGHVVDEFIAERRKEFAREQEKYST